MSTIESVLPTITRTPWNCRACLWPDMTLTLPTATLSCCRSTRHHGNSSLSAAVFGALSNTAFAQPPPLRVFPAMLQSLSDLFPYVEDGVE